MVKLLLRVYSPLLVGFSRILRLNVNGSLDEAFNPVGTGFNRWVFDIDLVRGGKIVVAGDYFSEYKGTEIRNGCVFRICVLCCFIPHRHFWHRGHIAAIF